MTFSPIIGFFNRFNQSKQGIPDCPSILVTTRLLTDQNIQGSMLAENWCGLNTAKADVDEKQKVSVQAFTARNKLVYLKKPPLNFFPETVARVKFSDSELTEQEIYVIAKLSITTSTAFVEKLVLDISIILGNGVNDPIKLPASFPKLKVNLGNGKFGTSPIRNSGACEFIDPNLFLHGPHSVPNYQRDGVNGLIKNPLAIKNFSIDYRNMENQIPLGVMLWFVNGALGDLEIQELMTRDKSKSPRFF